MSNNSGWSLFGLALMCLAVFVTAGCGAGELTEPPHNNDRIDGNWNVELTTGSPTTPVITFGLALTQVGAVVDGNIIDYTGSYPVTTSCLVFTGLTAHGTVDGHMFTLSVRDPGSSTTITLSGASGGTDMPGTFAANFGSIGSTPACANINGTLTMKRQ